MLQIKYDRVVLSNNENPQNTGRVCSLLKRPTVSLSSFSFLWYIDLAIHEVFPEEGVINFDPRDSATRLYFIPGENFVPFCDLHGK